MKGYLLDLCYFSRHFQLRVFSSNSLKAGPYLNRALGKGFILRTQERGLHGSFSIWGICESSIGLVAVITQPTSTSPL